MKKGLSILFFCLCLPILVPFLANAQSLPLDTLGNNADIKRFYEGCMKIREGEKTGSIEAYEDAMVLLNTFRGVNNNALKMVAMNATGVDTLAVLPIEEHVVFSRAYAKSKARQEPYKAEDLLRAIGRCRVKMFAIAPNSTVSYAEEVRGNCILIAIAGEPEAKVSLSAIEESTQTEHQASSYEDEAVAFSHWQMSENDTVKYVVKNNTDQIISVALVAN